MKKLKYELVIGKSGFEAFCKEVSERLNQGWKPIGGVAFNAGFAYQSIAKLIDIEEEKPEPKAKKLGASEAMRQLDQMT